MARKVTGYAQLVEVGTGPAGDSAYDTAVDGGFVGTEAEWIASLQGTIGVDGDRGPGRFEGSITLPDPNTPSVGSQAFNLDARELMCEALQGTWNSANTGSCSVSAGNPIAGDIVVITYTDSNGDISTRGAIHDGTGINFSDWQTFAVQIDGSLLVTDTVVGNAFDSATTITAGSGDNVAVLDGAHATYRIYAGDSDPADAPFRVAQDGSVSIKSDTNTANSRLELDGDTIKVYEGATLRVKLGNLT